MTLLEQIRNIVTALTQNPYDTEVLQSCIKELQQIIKQLEATE